MCNTPRRIQDEADPLRSRKRKAALSKSIPSVFPLPMTPGYASNWLLMAVRPAKNSNHQSNSHLFPYLQGNMKQHMLTHKIRDMPQHMFENKPPSLSGDDSTPLPSSLPLREQLGSDGELPLPQQPPQPQQLPAAPLQQPSQASPQMVKSDREPQAVKREPSETELPLPKRPPSK